MPRVVEVRQAVVGDHQTLSKMCKESPYTKDFTNQIFSGADCYAAGRVRVACYRDVILGFTCFRRRSRDGVTVLYFVGVVKAERGRGVGRLLMGDLHDLADGSVELKVMKNNRAVDLYRRLGYHRIGTAYDGKAWVMYREKVNPSASRRPCDQPPSGRRPPVPPPIRRTGPALA